MTALHMLPSPTTFTTTPAPAFLLARQIWVDPTTTSGSLPHSCTPFRLSSGGEINIGHGIIVTLTQDAGYQPICPGTSVPAPIDPLQPGVDLSVLDSEDPFYSSTNPQIYAIAAVTIVSYMLLIILFITPRTFFIVGAGGRGGFYGQRGMISGAYGSNSIIGLGSRPWLQKLAVLAVAFSMTIVTAETFTRAQQQYDAGYQDVVELTDEVIGGLEVRVVRTISETCLWLAQAQTLIRLFPRHKEKLMIKWIAFGLIILDLIFGILNHFLVEGSTNRPKRFVNAIPAINYLFAFALNLCYGGFVVYYALQKRRFAFYHPHMRNMPLVALLSLTAVTIPVVFFVLDLLKPNVVGWGSYVRWVGAASASVVVWEWVERIEALERDEKKDGILGREIFDGDEMLDATPSSDVSWPSSRRKPDQRRTSGSPIGGGSSGWTQMKARARRFGTARQPQRQASHPEPGTGTHVAQSKGSFAIGDQHTNQHPHLAPPPPIASPVSRADTTSAGSTVYMVRNHPISEPTRPIREEIEGDTGGHVQQQQLCDQIVESSSPEVKNTESHFMRKKLMESLQRVPNPFRRQRETPPPEVVRALAQRGQDPGATNGEIPYHASLLEKLHLKKTPKAVEVDRPPIVVPAPPRRRRSSAEDFDESGSEDDIELSTNRNQSTPSDSSATQDMGRPPDAVLNAIQNSHSFSPSSDHANPGLSPSEPRAPPFPPGGGSVVLRGPQRATRSPVTPAEHDIRVGPNQPS
ncbi:hypothetical protein ABVK25_000561 [Lepraria finkii]|uniref:Uncharacterized protein n=1 Tax=Lepraria finkii TaxID=1340010 RepID=A0ABR4BQS4_9LECA